MHRRIHTTFHIDPDLHLWIVQEARRTRISTSEFANRVFAQQKDVRQGPAANGADTQSEKLLKTLDTIANMQDNLLASLDLLKTMIWHGVRLLVDTKRFSQWEIEVQETLKGRAS